MSDGRIFTDYRPRCDAIAELMPSSAASSYEFRISLVSRAEEVMRNNMMAAYDAAACGPCDFAAPGTMLPEAALQRCDGSTCSVAPAAGSLGLGLGRNYGSYDARPGEDTGLAAARDAFLRKQAAEQTRLAREPNACAVASDRLSWAPLA